MSGAAIGRSKACLALLLAGVGLASGCERYVAQPVAPADLAGYWAGSFSILGDSVEVVLSLTESAPGVLSGRVSFPVQAIFDAPTRTEWDGRSLHVDASSLGGRFEGRLRRDGTSIRGDWFQVGGKFRLELRPASSPPSPSRPQEPRPPLPYRVQNVEISHSEESVTLSGTLTLPEGSGPYPAAVLVSGSGPQDRDESLFGHRPFLVLADYLTRAGIAVLRYDDRGVGDSSGDFADATSEDFATDAIAAVEFLTGVEGIDPDRVGIIGHSEGGIVAPMAAVRSDRVAFIVCLAGPGSPGRDLLELQTRLIMEASGVPAPLVALNLRLQSELLGRLQEAGDAEGAVEVAKRELESSWGGLPRAAIAALGLASEVDRALEELVGSVASPWMFFFLDFDPATAFQHVEVPVLALNGTLDLQVPPEPNLRLIEEAVKRGGNPNVTTMELEGLNHLFQSAETGLPSEYGRIEETMSPDALRIVSDWIHAEVPPPGAEGRSP